MILPTLAAAYLTQIPVNQVVETKLFRMQKGKVVPGSISVSPDLNHYSYSTTDKKVVIDGRTLGPYITNGTVLYSGDSKDYAFLAGVREKQPSVIIWNGTEKITEYPVSRIFRAGETGGICWGEVKTVITKDEKDPTKENRQDFTRLMHSSGATDWMEKIEKIYFSDDGSLFALRTSEKLPAQSGQTNNSGPTSRDYIVRKDGSKVPRGRVILVFPAPNEQGYATVSDGTTSPDHKNSLNVFEVNYRGRTVVSDGEFYGKPTFSPDGKQFAFRSSFTKSTGGGQNVQVYQYTIGGFNIPDLQVQTGLTFAPDGKKWVLCGMNGKDPYIYVSSTGPLRYDEFPMLNGAPPEPYKAARFANGKLVLLFQTSRGHPFLFVEDKGLVDLGAFSALPDTMSVSPDGTRLLLGGSDLTETRAKLVNLDSLSPATEVLKPGYELQNLGKGTFVWKGDHEVQFMITRKEDIIRVSAKL